jgi:MFS family permease
VKPTIPLLAVSFFAADVQAGAGPFLGIYLQEHGWRTDTIGSVLTMGAIVAMLVTTPAGALVDAISHRRSLVVGASALTIVAAIVIWLSRGYWPIASAQIATAVAGSLMGPTLTGLTLGMVGRKNFDLQYSRNQVANHAGNIAAALFSGAAGWRFGISYVFVLSAVFGVACIASVLLIPSRAVHRHYARGLAHDDDKDRSHARAQSVRVL